jgi:hypothetical protein
MLASIWLERCSQKIVVKSGHSLRDLYHFAQPRNLSKNPSAEAVRLAGRRTQAQIAECRVKRGQMWTAIADCAEDIRTRAKHPHFVPNLEISRRSRIPPRDKGVSKNESERLNDSGFNPKSVVSGGLCCRWEMNTVVDQPAKTAGKNPAAGWQSMRGRIS